MNLYKALDRLTYTISNGNKCNDTDIDAFNAIAEWIEREKEERLNHNHHFGKMVAWAYLNLYRCHSGNKKIVEREICEILEKDLGHHYELIRMDMEAFDMNAAFEFFGITDAWKSENWDNPEEGKKMTQAEVLDCVRAKHSKNKELIQENQERLIEALKPLKISYVNDGMFSFTTELLNRYANK